MAVIATHIMGIIILMTDLPLNSRLKSHLSAPIQEADPNASIRLWQLISPALPIGAYAYSQGLESAIEKNWLNNEEEVQTWISGILNDSLSHLDAPVLARLYQAWQEEDSETVNQWNQFLLACRESSELYHEDQQMGRALWRLLNDLLDNTDRHSDTIRELIKQIDRPGYVTIFALASSLWNIPMADAIRGFLWAWCENQVAAAIKLVPLGQTAGQRILTSLIQDINQGVSKALQLNDHEIGSVAPGFSIACAQHEVQYSRLFRS